MGLGLSGLRLGLGQRGGGGGPVNLSPPLSEFIIDSAGTGTWDDNGDGTFTFTNTTDGISRPGVKWPDDTLLTIGATYEFSVEIVAQDTNTRADAQGTGTVQFFNFAPQTITWQGVPTTNTYIRIRFGSVTAAGLSFTVGAVSCVKIADP